MAEGILNAMAQTRHSPVRAISCGLAAYPGDPAMPQAIAAVKTYGVDLTRHRARKITKYILEEADVIFCMTQRHKEMLLKMAPDQEEKLHCLCQRDIPDPFGKDQAEYEIVARELFHAIDRILEQEAKEKP